MKKKLFLLLALGTLPLFVGCSGDTMSKEEVNKISSKPAAGGPPPEAQAKIKELMEKSNQAKDAATTGSK